jgi:hypothetical protein
MNCLNNLPDEIIKETCILGNPIDLISLSLTCTKYYKLIDNNLLTTYILNNKYIANSSLYKHYISKYPNKLIPKMISTKNLILMYIGGFPCLFIYNYRICDYCNRTVEYERCDYCGTKDIDNKIVYKIRKILPTMTFKDVKNLANTNKLIKLFYTYDYKFTYKVLINNQSILDVSGDYCNQIMIDNNIFINYKYSNLYDLQFVIEI